MHAHAFPFTGWVGMGMYRTHKRYGAPNPIRSITRFHLYFTPTLSGCCGETMHTHAFPFTEWVGTGM